MASRSTGSSAKYDARNRFSTAARVRSRERAVRRAVLAAQPSSRRTSLSTSGFFGDPGSGREDRKKPLLAQPCPLPVARLDGRGGGVGGRNGSIPRILGAVTVAALDG